MRVKIKDIRNLVFSAGALGGICMIGAIRALVTLGMKRSQLHAISGCSIGSVIGMLYSIGYTHGELEEIALNFKYKHHADLKILSFLSNCGLETGNKIVELLENLIYAKTDISGLTFAQHWTITGRKLFIVASCLETNTPCYYSVETHPAMSVVDAVRRSISIPIIMASVKAEDYTYVDGGLHDAIPAAMFSVDNTICIKTNNNGFSSAVNQLRTNNDNEYERFLRYCLQLLACMHTSLHNYYIQDLVINRQYSTIDIPTGVASMTLNLKRYEKRKIMKSGYDATINLFRSN